ncbi:RMD1 family protein [Caulobacter sp. 17J65-9]|uniref:RMD1 family protein n=1 Tax=Caulobacter sp. 17J65-9 TaxID=2709382 RepID=UPI00196A0BFC|nr:RMD1 family protein [Caulobacter sp. 17J65-9]
MADVPPPVPASPRPLLSGRPMATARALLLGDRINTAGLERSDVYATSPLCFRVGDGFAAVFRYGVVVLVGLTPLEEDEVLRGLRPRVSEPVETREEEAVPIRLAREGEEGVGPDGTVQLRAFSPEHLMVAADVLAKSTALAHDEQQVASVFDTLEPFAGRLAADGRAPGGRRAMLKLIGSALLVQHRVSARVAVQERPDVLWDRPDLDRLYSRLEDEYELTERADTLNRKIEVIGKTATALTDLIDTQRSLRLEILIVLLIAAEIVLTLWQMAGGGH